MRYGKVSAAVFALAVSGSCYSAQAQVLQNTQGTGAGARIGLSAPAATAAPATAKGHVNRLPAPTAAAAAAKALPLNTAVSSGSVAGGGPTDTISPRAFGSFGIPYTSTRVQLGASNRTSVQSGVAFLASTFPYRAVGRLKVGTDSYCSASVIRNGIIVTAAHCIQDFATGGSVFGGWVFTPGTDLRAGATAVQTAPYGSFAWKSLIRPVPWANGTDTGSGAARNNDLALIALNKNSAGQLVGQLTGKLGYSWNNYSFISSPKTGNLAVAAVTTLGYPFLMDSGRIMQRSDGPTFQTTVGGALQLWQGSNFTGGSSGGPWVVNFGAVYPVLGSDPSNGPAVPGTHAAMAVIGVTSWGTADPNAPKDNYSSRFGQNPQYPAAAYGTYGAGNIGYLMNTLCALPANDGSGQTLAQRGWCS